MRSQGRYVAFQWPWWPITVGFLGLAITAGCWGISDRSAPRPLIWAAIIAMLVRPTVCSTLDNIRNGGRR